MKDLFDILPLYGVEHNAILSKMGDVTVAFKLELPELFTMSNDEYEAFHHSWIKAIKVLPVNAILHKQDWFTAAKFKPDFTQQTTSFLSNCSDLYFNNRPFLDHYCYLLITKKPGNRKPASSVFSSLLKRTIVPEETILPKGFDDFMNHIGQFQTILSDSGFVTMKRLPDSELIGLIAQYLNLTDGNKIIRDIEFKPEWKIGENYCQLYTMADAEYMPSLCGSRINYDKYSTDKTKFSIGFASPVGQLLSCNHIYNQYVFIEDVQKTIDRLKSN